MALINDPDLLLLDEPTAGINPKQIDKLIERLKEANLRGLTLLVIEHNMPAIMGLAQHIYCLSHSRLPQRRSASCSAARWARAPRHRDGVRHFARIAR